MLEAKKYKLNIPNDIGLITFGSLLSSEIVEPQITSIEQPENEIAQIAFELLEKLINQDYSLDNLADREVKAEIIFRESC